MKRFINYLLALLAVVILFESCEKDPEPEPVIEAISVSGVTPANNAIDVVPSATIKIDFSRTFDAKTTSGVSLLKGQTIVAVTQTTSGSSITLTPNTALENNTSYTVAIKGVKATDGALVPDLTSTFTTVKAPLTVESVTPADKGIGVKTDAKIVLKFNKKLSAATQTGAGITIVDKDNKVIVVTSSYDGANTITLTPKDALNSSEVYKVVVKGATADDGAVSQDFTSTFTVEKIPFTIVSITPADGATGVSVSSNVVIVFSKKLNKSVANGSEFAIAGMNVSTSVNTEYDGNKTITLKPTKPLTKNTLYVVFISSLSPLQSADGDILPKTEPTFTTEL